MAEPDRTHRFLESLPRVKRDDSFRFRCAPSVVCFNECCADLDLTLSPYDVLRLRRCLNMSSRQFLQEFTRIGRDPTTGFPCVSLGMRDDERGSCPFVGDEGCSVYADRPGACRAYPLGRGAGVGEGNQVSEQYVLLHEEHCKGFKEDQSWTVEAWLRDQGMDEYILCNDTYLRLTSRWSRHGRSLTREQFAVVFLALYRLDEFSRFIQHHGLFDGIALPESRKAAVLGDETERLSFAIEWIETVAGEPY